MTEAAALKFCKKCGKETERCKSGECKPCLSERNRKRRAANLDRERERGRKYWAANLGKCRDRKRKRRAQVPDEVRARDNKSRHKRLGLPVPTRPMPETCEGCGGFSIKALALDHDHITNAFRGWLCDTCNRGIGLFYNDPARLRQAASYLERAAMAIEGN